ncbi:MAG: hydroxymethylbilane synthase [Alphaproteobacteria bacterium]|nr:hydroxymethylbilane synthase [Alphaproteobacteria bacterium]
MRIGTRSSAMALAQTRGIAAQLSAARAGLGAEIVRFAPRGDRDQVSKLARHGGKGGAFVGEIRDALRDGSLDAAMHSLKDMPGDEEAPGLVIAAYLKREPFEDALVLREDRRPDDFIRTKAAGMKIGTNSVRRAAYLRRLYPQAEIIHYRGAADTRIRKLDERVMQKLPDGGEVGPADALVMAKCGLERVGFADRITHVFSADEMLCAVGQGIVAVECRRDDWKTREELALIDDANARCVAWAERELLWVLNGHCNAPIAGLATLNGDRLVLRAAVMSEDGQKMMEYQGEGEAGRPRELGRAAGLELLAKGAGEIIEASRL